MIGFLPGLLAFLSIPVVIIIHSLRSHKKNIPLSTFMFIEEQEEVTIRNNKFKLPPISKKLILQLLSLFFISLTLLDLKISKLPQVVVPIVIDSSYSMSAFKPNLENEFKKIISSHEKQYGNILWRVFESGGGQKEIAISSNSSIVLQSLKNWTPTHGKHSFDRAFNLSNKIGKESLLISDHKAPQNWGKQVLIGSNIKNAGITDVSLEGDKLNIVLKNFSNMALNVLVKVDKIGLRDSSIKEFRTVKALISPRGLKILDLPLDSVDLDKYSFKVRISGDEYEPDNIFYFIKPKLRPLSFVKSIPDKMDKSFDKLLYALRDIVITDKFESADVNFLQLTDDELKHFKFQGIIFLKSYSFGKVKEYDANAYTSFHPLVRKLDFKNLYYKSNYRNIPLTDADEPLLYHGSQPLVFLRRIENEKNINFQLIFQSSISSIKNFRNRDFAVLVFRYIKFIRSRLGRYMAKSYICGEKINLPKGNKFYIKQISSSKSLGEKSFNGILPNSSGLYALAQDSLSNQGQEIFASVYCSDIREGNFSRSISQKVSSYESKLLKSLSSKKNDPYYVFWLLAFSVLTFLWWWRRGS